MDPCDITLLTFSSMVTAVGAIGLLLINCRRLRNVAPQPAVQEWRTSVNPVVE